MSSLFVAVLQEGGWVGGEPWREERRHCTASVAGRALREAAFEILGTTGNQGVSQRGPGRLHFWRDCWEEQGSNRFLRWWKKKGPKCCRGAYKSSQFLSGLNQVGKQRQAWEDSDGCRKGLFLLPCYFCALWPYYFAFALFKNLLITFVEITIKPGILNKMSLFCERGLLLAVWSIDGYLWKSWINQNSVTLSYLIGFRFCLFVFN